MYGNWLPGDVWGFVSNVRDGDGPKVRNIRIGTEYDSNIPGLEQAAREKLIGELVRLSRGQAEQLFLQLQKTERIRGWRLFAVAIMANYYHLVVGVRDDPEQGHLLRDVKSYGSRPLNWK